MSYTVRRILRLVKKMGPRHFLWISVIHYVAAKFVIEAKQKIHRMCFVLQVLICQQAANKVNLVKLVALVALNAGEITK